MSKEEADCELCELLAKAKIKHTCHSIKKELLENIAKTHNKVMSDIQNRIKQAESCGKISKEELSVAVVSLDDTASHAYLDLAAHCIAREVFDDIISMGDFLENAVYSFNEYCLGGEEEDDDDEVVVAEPIVKKPVLN